MYHGYAYTEHRYLRRAGCVRVKGGLADTAPSAALPEDPRVGPPEGVAERAKIKKRKTVPFG